MKPQPSQPPVTHEKCLEVPDKGAEVTRRISDALGLEEKWPRGRNCFLITSASVPPRDNYGVCSPVRVKAAFKLLLS